MKNFKAPNIHQDHKKKVTACPVSYEQVDKHLIKTYSSIIFIVLLISLLTNNYIGMYLISIDFMIRVFIGIKYSPLCNFLTSFLQITPLKPKLVNAGTKKIAAFVGLLFSILVSVFSVLGFYLLAKIFIFIFLFAIGLDLFFDYCLACKMQNLYLRYIKK